MSAPKTARLGDPLAMESLRNQRDMRALLGQTRGRAGLQRLLSMTKREERQLGRALQAAGARGIGEAITVHSATCKTRARDCRCSVVVLVPGTTA